MAKKKRLGPKGGRTTRTTGGLVRKALFLRDDQDERLRRLAFERQTSESEIVREAVDAYLDSLTDPLTEA